jgi:hypothetical protein
VRIAKSSKEQDGYEAPDTTGARLKSLTREGIGDTTYRRHRKNKKIDFWFQEGAKKFLIRAASGLNKK